MKISKTTMALLKNYSVYNQHIVIDPGNIIKTINNKKNQVIRAEVEESFPVEVALHDLSGFLRVVGLFNEPDFRFLKKKVVISDDSGATQDYYYSETDNLIFERRDVFVNEGDVEVALPFDAIDKVIKASRVNNVEDIAFEGDGSAIHLKTYDKEKPKRVFSIPLGTTDKTFKVYLKNTKKNNKLNLLGLDYTLRLVGNRVCFAAETEGLKVTYIMAAELDSSWD